MRAHVSVRARVTAVAAAAATAVAGFAAPSAGATGPTVCDGTIARTQIEGDVVVPDTRPYLSCTLDRVLVRGDVVVEGDSDLITHDSEIQGDLVLNATAHADLRHTSVTEGVLLDGTMTSLRLGDSSVRRSVRGSGYFVELVRSRIDGALNLVTPFPAPGAPTGELYLTESYVGGWVNLHHGSLILEWSTLQRGLTSSGAAQVHVCGTTIASDATILRGHGVIGIGHVDPTFSWVCDTTGPEPSPWHSRSLDRRFAVQVGGDLVINNNPHSVVVERTTVAGDLECIANTGPRGVVAVDVQVGGVRIGQCA